MGQAKEAFANLVDGGILDKFIAGLTGLLESSLFSGFVEEGEASSLAKIAEDEEKAKKFNLTDDEKETLKSAETQITGIEKTATIAGSMAAGAATGAIIGSIVPGIGTAAGAVIGGLWGAVASGLATGIVDNIQEDRLKKAQEIAREKGIDGYAKESEDQEIEVEDFTIKTHPKDELVMAGGTNLGGSSSNNNEVATLLKELLTTVKKGGNVYMDGALVGTATTLAYNKL